MNTVTSHVIDKIAQGYRAAQVLFVAVRLGLFDALGKRSMTAAQLAKALQADQRAIRMLSDALVSLGILVKRGPAYANSCLSQSFLLANSPASQQALIVHNAALYERWARLFDAVKTGRPVPPDVEDQRLRRDALAFSRAMAASGSIQAAETAAKIDLQSAQRMLDIGGGPGVYAIAFARRWPELHVTVIDCAEAIAVARDNVKKAKLAAQITTLIGDAFEADLGGPYDFVLLSNVVHQYCPEWNMRLIERAAQALAPGGKLAVKDFVLRNSRTGPVGASLFAINMLVNTPGGDCYSGKEIRDWMRRAGLRPVGTVRLRYPSVVVLGRKPQLTVENGG
ncbi:MAG: methyltransferase [Verrucomicrobiota bacterium]|nr:methyltransferase [Verrucomicrobiota bacterium]